MNDGSEFSPSPSAAKAAGSPRLTVAQAGQRLRSGFPFTVAAPSFVLPAGVADNARFLAEGFPEIGLLFFETEACLAYTADDLPEDLAALDVRWHVHLSLDLPWRSGLDAAWTAVEGLMDKAAHLAPDRWVLHPPTTPNTLLPLARRFREAGVEPVDILLENVEETDLCSLWPEVREGGYGVCLDLGHVLAYGQDDVLGLPGLWECVRMLHVYGPEDNGRHASLAQLDGRGRDLLHWALDRFQGETLTLEVFNEHGLFESLDLLADWMAHWETAP